MLLLSMRSLSSYFFFFNDTATTEIYTLSLHDALPISPTARWRMRPMPGAPNPWATWTRSEEHTSELQSHLNLVCRLLLEKKKKKKKKKQKTHYATDCTIETQLTKRRPNITH